MKKYLFLFTISIISLGKINAQHTFSLERKLGDLKNNNLFEIISVRNISKSDSKYFGELFINETQKQKIGFKDKFEESIKDYYTFFNPKEERKIKLLIKIKSLLLSEKLVGNRMAEGSIKYEIEAYTITTKDTNRICSAKNTASYTRTLQNQNISSVENQVKTVIDGGLNYIIGYVSNSKSNLEAFATDSKVIIKPFFTKQSSDTVYYQQRKVTWADFHGPIRSKEQFGAAIFTSFGFDSKIFVAKNTITVEITPKVFTDKNMSWAKPEIKNGHALAHEQLHFDICYLMTLRFLEKIKTFKEETQDDLISRIQYEYLEFYRSTHKLQEQYDEETNHSLNSTKQLEWQNRISSELKTIDLDKIIN